MVEKVIMRSTENLHWHTFTVDEVLSKLDANRDGLSSKESEDRRKEYGANSIKKGKEISHVKILLNQISSPLVYVLLVAMGITLVIQHWADAIVIGIIVIINTIIGFIQENRAENAIQALINLSSPKATVRRDDKEKQVNSTDIVPGDIVLLEAGGIVPADLRLIESTRLQIDESLLTGESLASSKATEPLSEKQVPLADQNNLAFMGTAVTSGSGVGVVIATGQSTQMGSIAEEIFDTQRAESPLQKRMKSFGRRISIGIVGVAIVAVGAGVAIGEPLTEMFLTGVSLAVGAIPEGLPVVMTVALAVAIRKMAKRNAIIRRLPAVETLGSCTVILSDKTGTLTQNRMTVKNIWAGDAHFNMADSGFSKNVEAQQVINKIEKDSPLYYTLLAGVLANEAHLEKDGDVSKSRGDPTEVALLASGSKADLYRESLLSEYSIVDEIPFDSKQRYSASIHERDGKKLVFLKGAPERVVKMCISIVGSEKKQTMEPDRVLAEAKKMAHEGLRVLAMAMGEGPEVAESVQQGNPTGLTFLGLQGMMDPPREEAMSAVANCHKAGIRVIMVTGDNPTTAASIAQKVGLVAEKPEVINGVQMEKMSDKELDDTVRRVSVYARVSPSQKLRLVNVLRRQGEIIAVTGDGVNDAPALKSAHIGAAMGKAGTDVAKEASEMVLTDDSFATIYAAVEEGRTVFSNIRKATFFLLSSGAGEVILILTSLGMRLPLPLLPAQILWLNVVTNGVEDVALAFEPGEEEQFHRPPRNPKAGILSRLLIERTIIVGILMAAGTLGMFVWERSGGATLEYARATALTTMVMFQIFHIANCRSVQRSAFRKNPLSNKFLFVGVVISLAVHIGAMYFEPTQFLLRLEPLGLQTWSKLIFIALSVIVVVEIHKLLRKPGYAIRRHDPEE